MRRSVSSQVASASRLHPQCYETSFAGIYQAISSCSSCRAVSANVESPNSAVGVTTALKNLNLPLIDRCLFTNMNLSLLNFPHAALIRCAPAKCQKMPQARAQVCDVQIHHRCSSEAGVLRYVPLSLLSPLPTGEGGRGGGGARLPGRARRKRLPEAVQGKVLNGGGGAVPRL